jgi:hypothetical protein
LKRPGFLGSTGFSFMGMHRTRLTLKKKKAFLKELAIDANVSRCSRLLGLSRTCLYDHKKKYPEFDAAWEEAVETGINGLIDEMNRRAFRGVSQPVFHQGRLVGFKREFSDNLAMFITKAHRPEYRDKPIFDMPADARFSLSIDTGTPEPAADGAQPPARGATGDPAPDPPSIRTPGTDPEEEHHGKEE